jgi:hypothetical protein
MWIETAEGMRLIRELARAIVTRVAPEELELFDDLIEEYFNNPIPPDRARIRDDDPLAFGVDDDVAVVTPAAAAMTTTVIEQILSRTVEVAEPQTSEAVRRRLEELLEPERRVRGGETVGHGELEQILDSGRRRALDFGMGENLALSMEGVLVSTLTTRWEASVLEEAKAVAPEPEAGSRRYANVCMTRLRDGSVVPGTLNLARNTAYRLRFDIGPLSQDSVVENALEEPIPTLPESEEGNWLEVIIVSDDFLVPRPRHWLFLPNGGPSWVCDCERASRHVCAPERREPYLFIDVSTPADEDITSARLRIALYYKKNLVQSQSLEAAVGEEEEAGEGYRSRVDYTLSGRLAQLGSLPARTLNVLTNRNENGTHKLVFNGAEGNALDFNLTEGQLSNVISAVRQALRDIHYEEYGGALRAERQRRNRFDAQNGKPRDAFVDDLAHLASLGRRLWTLLLGDRPSERRRLRDRLLEKPATIQVSRTRGTEFVFPWGLVYDIPLESDTSKHVPCRLLEDWDRFVGVLEDGDRVCPYEADHVKNTLCPFGFWGFKHTIEQPPSIPDDRVLPLVIVRPGGGPLEFVVGRSTDLDSRLASAHLGRLTSELAVFILSDCDSLTKLVQALANPSLEVLYLYCHGRREAIPGMSRPVPFIEVGTKERIAPDDLITWDDSEWTEDHWRETSPLVFINGCHTAELEPEAIVNFVDAFSGVYAAGVIGTEIALHQRVANEAAEAFFAGFKDNLPVGESLRRMRNRFLSKGNLLGLAYTAYCSADLRLAEA